MQYKYHRLRIEREKKLENTLTVEEWEEALKYFNYRDAYTGEKLYDLTKDHIIPITQNGGLVKENIVPCNRDTNSSKQDGNMLEWYRKQPFYSKERLDKILKWMGDYSKHLYNNELETEEERPFGTMQKFTIILPNRKRHSLYYNSLASFNRKGFILYETVLKKWEGYCRDNWLIHTKTNYYNAEDNVKYFLDRCADFLLKTHSPDTLSKSKKDMIYKAEMPISSESASVRDMFYSENHGDDTDNYFKIENKGSSQYLYVDYRDKEQVKKSPFVDGRDIRRIKKNDNYKDQKTTKINKLKKTKFKNKNIYGEWALVDTEGVFVFNNKRFKISDKCNQYQGKLTLVSGRKKDREYEYRYDMDKILCYIDLDNNTYYFYDEKINDVTNFISFFK